MSSCLSRTQQVNYPSWYQNGFSVLNSNAFDEAQCTGLSVSYSSLSDSQWMNAWSGDLASGRSCVQVYNDLIHTSANGYLYSSAQLARVQSDFSYMFDRYFSNHDLSPVAEVGYTNFQTTLISACAQVPGACQTLAPRYCASCSRTQIAAIADLTNLCGCFAPPINSNFAQVSTVCDPLCSQGTVAKLVDSSNGLVQECQDTICVIDNVSVSAAESLLGNVSLTQVCPGCTASRGCKCIVDASVLALQASLGITDYTVFQQYCPPEFSSCLQINSVTGTTVEVPCVDSYTAPVNPPVVERSIPLSLWVIAGLILVIVLAGLIIYIDSEHNAYYDLPKFIGTKHHLSGYTSSFDF